MKIIDGMVQNGKGAQCRVFNFLNVFEDGEFNYEDLLWVW